MKCWNTLRTGTNMNDKVFLRLEDQDRHGAGCKCGKCNRNGKSYGVGAFRFDVEDALFVSYGPSEEAAFHNAKMDAQAQGLEVFEESCDELTAIARKHLDIGTLEARRSDSLDFHEVSVWGLKAALQAAFDAGKEEESTANAEKEAGESM